MFVLCLFKSGICDKGCGYRDCAFMMQRFSVIWWSFRFLSFFGVIEYGCTKALSSPVDYISKMFFDESWWFSFACSALTS